MWTPTWDLTTVGLSAAVLLTAYLISQVAPFFYHQLTTPLRFIPGPPSPSWFFGNFKETKSGDVGAAMERWIEKYGHVMKFKFILNVDRLVTMDTKALNHVLTHSVDYQKPWQTRSAIARVLGDGVLFTEAEVHRKQRRIMNPAFGPAQIRELTGIFVEKSVQLRDIWNDTLAKSTSGIARIDVLDSLTRMTLDVIGLAGFSYKFDALNPLGKTNELNQALGEMFGASSKPSLAPILEARIPVLRLLPTKRSRMIHRAQSTMRRIELELIADKKAAILADTAIEKSHDGVSKQDLQGRDLLTLLIKANMAIDIPENQRLSDDEVLSQVPTFFVAGHETTASAVTWCLYALSLDKRVQQKLREEVLTLSTDTPTMEELMALPYLDNVLRETLRLHAPVSNTVRVAMKDDVIPLNKSFTDTRGEVHDGVKVTAGDCIIIPILALHRSNEFWGEDALQFKPERWEDPPDAISSIPGVWGNLLSFLGGPRACIGYRFTLAEFKAIVFTLVRSFEFELAVSPSDIGKKSTIVTRPVVLSEPDKGNQMPLIVKSYRS